jgi:predicted AlkP superfamily phosphohydrolase/phosphomutase
MSGRHRTVTLGLDSCDPSIVRRLAGEGLLPNFARLLAGSARAPIRHDPWLYVASLWPSFSTALDPSNHGFTCWAAIEPGTYEDADLPIGASLGRPFWEAVSDAGRRVGVIDVPHSEPPTDLDGEVVVDRGSHDRHGPPRSFPASVCGELDGRAGLPVFGHRGSTMIGPCDRELRDGPVRTTDEQVELHSRLVRARQTASRAALALFDRDDWDLFCAVLADTHCTGHQFWHLHDRRHPRHDAQLVSLIGDAVVASYRHADETLGAVMERLDDDTTLFVMLSHGMGPAYDGSALVDPILTRAAAVWRGDAGWARHPFGTAASRIDRTPRSVRLMGRVVAGALRQRPAPTTAHDPLERSTQPWFGVPGPQRFAGVRLNLIGREPAGIIAPGAEADRVVSALREFLLELVDVGTGSPAVEAVFLTASRFRRRAGDRLPDVVVQWRDDAPLLRVWSARLGQIATTPGHWRTGDHRERAQLLVSGSGVSAGQRPALGIADVPATIAAATGVPLDDVDGRARRDLLPAGAVAGRLL